MPLMKLKGLNIRRNKSGKWYVSLRSTGKLLASAGSPERAASAIKFGAREVFSKPVSIDLLARRIAAWDTRRPITFDIQGVESLTMRELEVLSEILSGRTNKEAGKRLQISPRTVEVHRSRIMSKLGVTNAVELVRKVLASRKGPSFFFDP